MLTLFVENAGHSEPIVPVRWCVSKDILEVLREQGVRRPHLLLSVLQKKEDGFHREVARKLVPLEQGLEYIEFGTSGEHVLNAIIVWATSDTFWMKDCILARSGRKYREGAYSDSGDFETWWFSHLSERRYNSWQEVEHLRASMAAINIVIGNEFFAEEPSALESWWVNLWHREMPFDQCEFRRRRIIAYSIQPPLVLVWVVFSVLNRLCFLAWLLFLGNRGIKLSPIIHPFMNDKEDVCTEVVSLENSVFLFGVNGAKKPWYIWPLWPPVATVIALIAWSVNHFSVWDWTILALAIIGAGFVLGVALFKSRNLLFGLIRRALDAIDAKWEHGHGSMASEREHNARQKRFDKQRAAEEKKWAKEQKKRDEAARLLALLYENDMRFVACTGAPLEAKVTALPKERRTVHLRFQELKAKVCRPFAQN